MQAIYVRNYSSSVLMLAGSTCMFVVMYLLCISPVPLKPFKQNCLYTEGLLFLVKKIKNNAYCTCYICYLCRKCIGH